MAQDDQLRAPKSPADLLSAQGERVSVSIARRADIDAYRRAMRRSASRIGVWNPVNPDDLVHHLAAQSEKHRTFLIRAAQEHRVPHDEVGLVGCVNVTNVVQGRFMSATMGYNAFDPYAGTGLFGEGLKLVVDVALKRAPEGMGLHRIEANVRIGNAASAGVLRALGFRRERTVRRMLWLADGLDGASAWRDHDSYAVTREEWPAAQYTDNAQPGGVLVLDESAHVPMAVAVARELGGLCLFDVPYDVALQVARHTSALVLWCADRDAPRAVEALTGFGIHADNIDLRAADGMDDRAVTRAALCLRPLIR